MDKVLELESKIKRLAKSYYTGFSEVSDEEFDSLVDELKSVNPDSELLKTPGWGFTPDKKIPHKYGLRVGSLGKVKSESSIPYNFKVKQIRLSAKLDGLSVVSYYKDGHRILSLTRGNGTEGIDVTDKMNKISPETEELGNDFSGAIRGEVLISEDTWNNDLKSKYEDNPSANPRNVSAGLLNRKDITDELKYLDYVTYKVIAEETDKTIRDTKDVEDFLLRSGFMIAPSVVIDGSELNEVLLRNKYDEFCKTYPCDGIVITEYLINVVDNKYEYNEVAFKFQAEYKIVEVTDVTYNLTRTGKMVPLIWFDPVELSGAMVRKCSGFNAKYIKDNKINKGTKIKCCRSGEVIPYVLEVVESSDEGLLPEVEGLVWSGVDLVINDYQDDFSYHFIRTVAPVDGAGWSLYSKICEALSLSTPDTLLRLYEDVKVNGIENVIFKLTSQISGYVTSQKIKEILSKMLSPIDPVRFLVACSIKGLSWNTLDELVKTYPEILSDVSSDSVNEGKLYEVDGFGWKSHESFMSSVEVIKSLLEYVKIDKISVKEEVEVSFKVAITGSLSVKRSDFDAKLKEVGIAQSGNFKEIKYLITNNPDSTSSKMNNAKKYGVEIISEEEFTKRYL